MSNTKELLPDALVLNKNYILIRATKYFLGN